MLVRHWRTAALMGALALLISLIAATSAFAVTAIPTVTGPVYPLPAKHGGNTCVGSSGGSAGDGTWNFGGGVNGGTTGSSTCTDAGNVSFNTAKFQALYWGINTSAPPSVSSTFNPGGNTLTYDSVNSNPMSGIAVFTSGAFRLQLTVRDASGIGVPLTDAASVGVGSAAGVVVPVTSGLTWFSVQRQWTYNGSSLSSVFQNCNFGGSCYVNPSTTGAFYYVNKAPTGDFTFPTPKNRQLVTFTASNLADDADTPSYSWDLNGDGTYGDGPNQSASTNFAPGTHTVGLEITDSEGAKTHVTHTFTVTNAAPTGDFDYTTPANHQAVTFTAKSLADDYSVAGYSWDLNGDGTYGDNPGTIANPTSPSQAYGPGTHTVGLRITDNDGATTDVTHSFTITNAAPTATLSISPDDPPATHETVTLHADPSDSDGATPDYSWDLAGGTDYTDGDNKDVTASFGPGTHTVAVLVTDQDGATTRVTKTFTVVNNPPTGDFDYTPPANHQAVTFTAKSLADDSQVAGYTWDLNGDGTYGDSANQDASQAYGPGTHTVGLEITDDDGATTDVTHTFTITNALPTATISISPDDPPATHETVTLHADPSDTDGATPDYSWDLAGGTDYTDGTNKDVTTSFGPGTHTVAVLVTDQDGGTKRVTKTFTVVNNAPTGDFDFTTPANHQAVTFTAKNLADDSAVAGYTWDLNGDGTYGDSANQAASATFGPGTHTVGLEITDDDGQTTDVTHSFTITNADPTAAFTCLPASPTTDDTVTCTATATDPDAAPGDPALDLAWDWNGNNTFTDAADKTGSAPSGKFPAGDTVVTLRVTDRDGGVKTISHTITATAPVVPGSAGGGSATGTNNGGGLTEPANLMLPFVVGTPAVGQTISCDKGIWSANPSDFAIQWMRDGAVVPGATAATYVLTQDDGAMMLACRVTATNAAGSRSATSGAVRVAQEGGADVATGGRVTETKSSDGTYTVDPGITISCPPHLVVACGGSNHVTTNAAVTGSRASVLSKLIAAKFGFSTKSGTSKKISLHLSRRASELLDQKGKLTLVVSVITRNHALQRVTSRKRFVVKRMP
jgi:hypothetical protein